MYLLDSNVLINFLKGDEELIDFLDELRQPSFAISVITRFEVLIGAEKHDQDLEEIESYLDDCENVVLTKEIVKRAVKLSRESKKKLKFKDLIIAATAIEKDQTLLSSDLDFKGAPGLEVEFYAVSS